MESGAEFLLLMLRDIETFEETATRLVKSVRKKRKLIAKLVSGNQRSPPTNSPTSSLSLSGEAVQLQVPQRVVDAWTGFRPVVETALERVRREVHSRLDQVVSHFFNIDLSPLFDSEIGRVIRSFQAVSAETLGEAVDVFAKSGGALQGGADLCLLLRVGAEVDGLVEGRTALMRAVKGGCVPAVRVLVGAGASLEIRSGEARFEGFTALHHACYESQPKTVTFLVDAGADVRALDDNQRTPLACAAFRGPLELLPSLISRGADPQARTRVGTTLLHQAAAGGHSDITHFLLDLEDGLGVNVGDRYGFTPLHATVHVHEGEGGDHSQVVETLLNRGADINARTAGGDTTLILAAFRGCVKVAELLVQRGADVHARDSQGMTALHHTVLHSCDEMGLPLHFDVEKKISIAQVLVASGGAAAVVAKDSSGRTAVQLAQVRLAEESSLRKFLEGLGEG
uniref:Uncharacterized protein n=1 Tax=Chromera velia CCMP2878 TaxID=1169474 RepID=A0A0G4GTF0_9ALVE|eukprot:Cvel_23317.t1-p1 / transcript=Cvel_23317.t1 / gene=Cvel_23317 / organism=Chromera_velia_CCMP2878 / gene_product=Ankyrin-3, putative / transcript_product=Ankyrin-3, putative / location=Cvel_scaffold2388:14692-16053(+) / protein_length=454 / sequence_SO=supercontig / SO=protein_coding / is_pseudo=false